VISWFNHLVFAGRTAVDAMYHAAEERMRPTLMMALSACIGLFPAAISTGIGSQVQRPLATVVVGGMLLGPVMLLVVAPALQVMVVEWSQKRRTRRRPPAREIGEQP
jgi:cobalt-zinc-cadmium resistance protein CzcA